MIRTKHRTDFLAASLLAALGLVSLPVHAQPAGEEPEPTEPEPAPAPAPTPAPEEAAAPPSPMPPPAPPPAPEAAPMAQRSGSASARSPEAELEELGVAEGPGTTRAHSDFVDTRLTWTFGDDDFLHKTGEAIPLSPNASVGDRPQYRLFFDNLNSRFSGRENVSHLVLYGKLPGYIKNLDTEAALVMRVNMANLASQSNNVNAVFEDAGTYLRVFYRTAGDAKAPEGIGLVLYPIDTDRFRLGYLYDISWGGTNARINQSIFPRLQGSAPGAKLQYDGNGYYGFVGFKTASIVEVQQRIVESGSGEGATTDTVRVAETNYGFLGGAGVDLSDFLRVDAGAGYFQQGRFEEPDVLGERVYTFGFSGRVVVHDGMPVPKSADFSLYRNDPNAPAELFRAEEYEPGKLTWSIAAEASQLHQNLKDFDQPGATDIQLARAAALQANVKFGYLRTSFSAIYRDLPFVLRNQPSFIPFQTIPNDAKTQDETFFAVSTDYFIESAKLTPGVGAGLQMPATFSSESFDPAGNDTSRTIVVREQGNLAFLPQAEKRVPILQARASLKWDLSPMMSAVTWLQYRRDNNSTRLELDPSGTVLLRRFISPDFVGYGVAMQARF
ncbi:MAG: hypothetical protein KC776_16220 [Myxococcales bacterium]|nr:hypothetical protein [Myxococcales bacterium]MCB9580757.1 hypothetical protein [Polyangiaceae bacterium]